jgi:hypothetical protein
MRAHCGTKLPVRGARSLANDQITVKGPRANTKHSTLGHND